MLHPSQWNPQAWGRTGSSGLRVEQSGWRLAPGPAPSSHGERQSPVFASLEPAALHFGQVGELRAAHLKETSGSLLWLRSLECATWGGAWRSRPKRVPRREVQVWFSSCVTLLGGELRGCHRKKSLCLGQAAVPWRIRKAHIARTVGCWSLFHFSFYLLSFQDRLLCT